jgi:hypothetical protein
LQEKSAEKFSVPARLKRLKVVNDWNWDQVASALGVSDQMIYKLLKNTPLSDEIAFKLERAEEKANIPVHERVLTQIAASSALVRERGTPENFQEVFDQVVGGEREVDVWRRRCHEAETRNDLLRSLIREALEKTSPNPLPPSPIVAPTSSKPPSGATRIVKHVAPKRGADPGK